MKQKRTAQQVRELARAGQSFPEGTPKWRIDLFLFDPPPSPPRGILVNKQYKQAPARYSTTDGGRTCRRTPLNEGPKRKGR